MRRIHLSGDEAVSRRSPTLGTIGAGRRECPRRFCLRGEAGGGGCGQRACSRKKLSGGWEGRGGFFRSLRKGLKGWGLQNFVCQGFFRFYGDRSRDSRRRR